MKRPIHMRGNRVRAMVGLLAALLVALAVAIVSAEAQGAALHNRTAHGKHLSFAYFGAQSNPVNQSIFQAATKVAKKNGVSLTFIDVGFDPAKEYTAMTDAIQQKKYQAFIVFPDGPAIIPAIENAGAAGIKVASVNYNVQDLQTNKPTTKGLFFVVADPVTSWAKSAYSLIADGCGNLNPCKVGWIASAASSATYEQIMIKDFRARLKANPRMQLVTYLDGAGYSRAGGQKLALDVLQAHPDINVLYTAGDETALGAYQSVKSMGLQRKVKLIGEAGSAEGIAAVKSGVLWGTWMLYTADEGNIAMNLLIQAVNGTITKPRGVSPAAKRLGQGLPPFIDGKNVSKFKGFAGQWHA